MSEGRRRSLLKAVTWRIFSSLVTGVLIYGLTGSPFLASSVALLDVGLITLCYYLHERLWNKIKWGKSDAD